MYFIRYTEQSLLTQSNHPLLQSDSNPNHTEVKLHLRVVKSNFGVTQMSIKIEPQFNVAHRC